MNRQSLAQYLEVANFALGKPKNNDDMRKQNGTYSQERPMKSLDLRSREAVGVREWMMVMMLMMVPVLMVMMVLYIPFFVRMHVVCVVVMNMHRKRKPRNAVTL